MSEEPVIYTTLSQQKHTPKNNIKHKFRSNELPLTKEELKHQKSCKKWHKNTAEDVNGQGDSSPLPWRLISVVLGIMCLLLMAIATAVAVLTANSSSKQSSLTIQQKGLRCHSCPKNWFWFRCSCYYFSKERLTWRESQHACSSLNSSLIKINREEMSTIMELASTGYGKMIRFCLLICFILLDLKKDNSVYLTNQEKFI